MIVTALRHSSANRAHANTACLHSSKSNRADSRAAASETRAQRAQVSARNSEPCSSRSRTVLQKRAQSRFRVKQRSISLTRGLWMQALLQALQAAWQFLQAAMQDSRFGLLIQIVFVGLG